MGLTTTTKVDNTDRAAVPKFVAALIEVVSILAALGFSHLVAGLLAPGSSPFQAVADAVVRLSPPALTEFGKSLDFPAIGLPRGVADKALLLVGVALVILVVAVLAGIAARRRRLPGVLVIGVLGVVGLAAVVVSPVFTPIGVVAPVVALVVGLGAFSGLYRLATRSAAAVDGGGVSRRGVLLSTAAVGVGAVGAGLGGFLLGGATGSRESLVGRLRPALPAPPVPAGADFASVGTPAFITANRDFYRIDVALRIPEQAASDWSMRIHGMVDRELRLTYADLLARPLLEKTITITCVSNEVNGDLISTSNFIGVSLRDLLLEAGVRQGAEQIFSTSIDGWTAGTPTDVVMAPDSEALLAIGMNGQPLPPEHGFPVRMVVPGLYGFVSATKWLADLELTTFAAKQSYWLRRGWAERAPIKTECRIDKPGGFETLTPGPNGKVTLAGIAWAQTRGIEKVELRLDDTGPWLPVQLGTQVNLQTWRMWRYDTKLAPGSHFVQCRATDATGAVQTMERAKPIPDGASGWPGISFSVA
ncbi:MAG: molybdopterin-dependent oxidoreductase [Pseudonocardia sp.]